MKAAGVAVLVVLGIAGWWLAWVGGNALGAAIAAHAQEKSAHTTRQWQAATIKREWLSDVLVHVVDTEGVCLYVVVQGDHTAVTAVAKTLLPRGVGCQ